MTNDERAWNWELGAGGLSKCEVKRRSTNDERGAENWDPPFALRTTEDGAWELGLTPWGLGACRSANDERRTSNDERGAENWDPPSLDSAPMFIGASLEGTCQQRGLWIP